jgi:hypothetical protein
LSEPDTLPTWGRLDPDHWPFSPDFFSSYSFFAQLVDVDQPAQHRLSAVTRPREHQLVDDALASAAAMDQQVLQLLHPDAKQRALLLRSAQVPDEGQRRSKAAPRGTASATHTAS